MTFVFYKAESGGFSAFYTGFELLKASDCTLWATSEVVSLSDGTWTRLKVSISLTTGLSCHSGCETFTDSLRGGGRQTEAWQRRKHAKSSNATQVDWWERWTALTAEFIWINRPACAGEWRRLRRAAKWDQTPTRLFEWDICAAAVLTRWMDPLPPAEMDRESDGDARRKIQFSVPSPVATQLDPRQIEMVSVGKNRIKPEPCFRITIKKHLPSQALFHLRVWVCVKFGNMLSANFHPDLFGIQRRVTLIFKLTDSYITSLSRLC